MNERFFLDRDDSGHWYVIPVALRDQWEAFLEDDEEFNGDAPAGIREVNGWPGIVTFTDPVFN